MVVSDTRSDRGSASSISAGAPDGCNDQEIPPDRFSRGVGRGARIAKLKQMYEAENQKRLRSRTCNTLTETTSVAANLLRGPSNAVPISRQDHLEVETNNAAVIAKKTVDGLQYKLKEYDEKQAAADIIKDPIDAKTASNFRWQTSQLRVLNVITFNTQPIERYNGLAVPAVTCRKQQPLHYHLINMPAGARRVAYKLRITLRNFDFSEVDMSFSCNEIVAVASSTLLLPGLTEALDVSVLVRKVKEPGPVSGDYIVADILTEEMKDEFHRKIGDSLDVKATVSGDRENAIWNQVFKLKHKVLNKNMSLKSVCKRGAGDILFLHGRNMFIINRVHFKAFTNTSALPFLKTGEQLQCCKDIHVHDMNMNIIPGFYNNLEPSIIGQPLSCNKVPLKVNIANCKLLCNAYIEEAICTILPIKRCMEWYRLITNSRVGNASADADESLGVVNALEFAGVSQCITTTAQPARMFAALQIADSCNSDLWKVGCDSVISKITKVDEGRRINKKLYGDFYGWNHSIVYSPLTADPSEITSGHPLHAATVLPPAHLMCEDTCERSLKELQLMKRIHDGIQDKQHVCITAFLKDQLVYAENRHNRFLEEHVLLGLVTVYLPHSNIIVDLIPEITTEKTFPCSPFHSMTEISAEEVDGLLSYVNPI